MRVALTFALLLLALPAGADTEQPVPSAPGAAPPPVRAVVELFTSQGCSYCPEADSLLRSYIDDRSIIALSLPVSYWDYIGWKDTLASPRNNERQRMYADRFGIDLYTPQLVVSGAAQVLGSNREEIDVAVKETAAAFEARRVPMHFWNHDNVIIIEAGGAPKGAQSKEATIWLAVVQKSAIVDVKAGENAGRTLTYYNVVRELTPIGLWNGRPAQIRLARTAIMHPDTEKLIVLLQENDTGLINGAARLGD